MRCIGLQKIAAARGLMYAIAKRFDISRFAVYQWEHVPEDRLAIVAEMSGLPVAELTRDRATEWRAKVSNHKRGRMPTKKRKAVARKRARA